jgi:hypothetical protein
MKLTSRVVGRSVAVAALALAVFAGNAAAAPVSTAFTYQGEIRDAAGLVTGGRTLNIRFRLFDAAAAGVQVGEIFRTVTPLEGRFTTELDYGAAPTPFAGQARWLEIAVETSPGVFTTLAGRQALTATPYSQYTLVAGDSVRLNGQAASFYRDASNLNAGTIGDARLPANIARTGANQTFTGNNTFNNAANTFAGNGAALTSLNGSNITSGTIGDARLSANIARLNANQAFSGANSMNNAANVFSGTFNGTHTGVGTGLTALDASNIAGGTLGDARLSTNVALLNAAQTFSAAKTFDARTIFNNNVFVNRTSAITSSEVFGLRTNFGGALYGGMYIDTDSVTGKPFYGYATGGVGRAWSYFDGTTNQVRFYNSGDRMVISSTGNVGIGTAAPLSTAALHVVNNGDYGLYVDNNDTVGAGYGINVRTTAPSGRAIYGNAESTTGVNYGGYFYTPSTSGRGVYAEAGGETGTTYGVYTTADSPDGYALYASKNKTTGTTPVIYASNPSQAGSSFGIHSEMTATAGGGFSTAVRGQHNSTSGGGIGVWGSHDGSGFGVYGTAATGGYGVYGTAGGTGSGVRGFSSAGEGVYGSSGSGYGGYFSSSSGTSLYVVGTASVGVLQIRGGADLAEKFEMNTAQDIKPGMVVMIDDEKVGQMELATGRYNKRVAGVISGANELGAGMILGSFDNMENGMPVALSGRVWTFVDASDKAVEAGDLLTTSDTPGYAMPVIDDSAAHGATIGKAMSRLAKGEKGMVLVLVNLQ